MAKSTRKKIEDDEDENFVILPEPFLIEGTVHGFGIIVPYADKSEDHFVLIFTHM